MASFCRQKSACNHRHSKEVETLTGSHFTTVFDQRNVSFIFDVKHLNKIKKNKLACWRLELSVFNYDIIQYIILEVKTRVLMHPHELFVLVLLAVPPQI